MSQFRFWTTGSAPADVLVLGAGRAGIAAASAALGLRVEGTAAPTSSDDAPARSGRARVVLVDGAPVGRGGWGGRDPLSVLSAAVAEGADWERARRAVLDARRQAQPRHDALLARLREAAEGRLTVVSGWGKFTGRGRVLVRPRGGLGDQRLDLHGRRIVVATGSTARLPRVTGLDETRYLTTGELDLLLEEEDPPASVAVIGAGASGCATAQLLARLGVQVTLVEAAERVLPREDPKVAMLVTKALNADGVRVMRSLEVSTVAPTLDGGAWFGTQDGGDIAAERLVVATGWRPDAEGLAVQVGGAAVTRQGGVAVNDRLSAGYGEVFAAGSVTGSRPCPSESSAMGRVAGANAVLRRSMVRWVPGGMPYRSRTDPVFVRVGVGASEDSGLVSGEARSEAPEGPALVSVRVFDPARSGRGGERGTLQIRGVTAVGPGAEDLAAFSALALRAGLSVEDLRDFLVPQGAQVRVLQQALASLTVPSGGSGRPASQR